MKKTLLKIGIIAGCLLGLSAHLVAKLDSFCFQMFNSKLLEEGNNGLLLSIKRLHSFNHLLDGLKSYHIGLNTIHSNYSIPTLLSLHEQIRSHPYYAGKAGFPKIYEVEEANEPYFYLVHAQGVRHFTLSSHASNGASCVGIDNGTHLSYPTIYHFIRCTFDKDART